MTHATDSPPVSAPLDPAVLTARARELSTSLQSLVDVHGLTPGDTAADLLSLSPGALVEAMASGALDGVIVGGKVYAVAEQVHLRVLDEARHGAARAVELATEARAALRGFLADRPCVALWDEARGDQRPLICARRGSRFVHYGIEYHSIVLRSQWVAMWAYENRDRFPELSSVPIGPAFDRALLGLHGVSAASNARPLAGEVSTRKLSGAWIKVDPRVWTVQVPAGLARLVDEPQTPDEDDR